MATLSRLPNLLHRARAKMTVRKLRQTPSNYTTNIRAASGAGDREVGFLMYKVIDFPSPLLLFLALFLCLALSCSLFLSLVVVVVSGLSPDRGLSAHPRLSTKKSPYLDYLPTLYLKRCVFVWDVFTFSIEKLRTSDAKTHLLRQSAGR